MTKSSVSVAEGMSQIVDFYSERKPHPDWERFRELGIEDDRSRSSVGLSPFLHQSPPNPRFRALVRACEPDTRGPDDRRHLRLRLPA